MIGEINLKVILRDGIVESVLCDDTRVPILTEIVDLDKDYRDYEALRDLADELYRSPKYEELPFTYADRTDEEGES